MKKNKLLAIFILLALAVPQQAHSARIKDISSVAGMRDNQLIGYGLMVGLHNSGDHSTKSPFTIQTLLSMLKRLGTTVDVRQLTEASLGTSDTRYLRDIRVENIAAVMITANLPPFARPGQRLDVNVSSLGDAKSLEGGTLLLTPLKAANGEVFGVAQGTLPTRMKSKSKKQRTLHIPTSGVISGGGIVEKRVNIDFASKSRFQILLNRPDFSTANSVVNAANQTFGEKTAKGLDAGTVELILPEEFKGNPFGFLSVLEVLEVQRDSVAKVVLDEKTGTVVIGENVQINNVAISFGEITVEVKNPFLPPSLATESAEEKLNVISQTSDINSLVNALNALGVSPGDLVAIFKSLRAAGALNADLEVL